MAVSLDVRRGSDTASRWQKKSGRYFCATDIMVWCWKYGAQVANTSIYKPQNTLKSRRWWLPRGDRTARIPCQSTEIHKRVRSKNLLRENAKAVIPPHTLHANRHIWDLPDLRYTQEQCYCTLTSKWTSANISITLPINESAVKLRNKTTWW